MNVFDLLKNNRPTIKQSKQTIHQFEEEQAFAVAALAEVEAELSSALLAKAEEHAQSSVEPMEAEQALADSNAQEG